MNKSFTYALFALAAVSCSPSDPSVTAGHTSHALTTPRNTTPPPAATQSIRVLQANVGNASLGCSPFYKLCYSDVEQRMAANIAAYDPDVVLFEETTPDWACRYGNYNGSSQVCYNYTKVAVRDQVRRLLGFNYSIVCDWYHGWDCIAIKTSAGYFQNDSAGRSCPPGYLCGSTTFSTGSYVDGIPMANADPYFATYYAQYNSSAYDNGFHIMAADAVVRGKTMRLIVSAIRNRPAQATAPPNNRPVATSSRKRFPSGLPASLGCSWLAT